MNIKTFGMKENEEDSNIFGLNGCLCNSRSQGRENTEHVLEKREKGFTLGHTECGTPVNFNNPQILLGRFPSIRSVLVTRKLENQSDTPSRSL